MRLNIVAGLALAGTVLSACTSSSTTDVLTLTPSKEVVSSITPNDRQSDVSAVIDQQDLNPYPVISANQPAVSLVDPMSSALAPNLRTVEVASVRPQNPARLTRRSSRQTIYGPKFRDVKPINFGRASPVHFDVHGVDVSRWQGKIDWNKLRKQGANFAFIKSTDGGDHLDPNFKENWKAAKAAGVPRGAYHFMYWCRSGESQAKWFIRNVPREKGALPPVIDAEWNHQSKTCRRKPSPKLVRARMKVFMEMVERHYGQRPIIYTAPDFYEDNLQGHFKNYPFWLRSVAAHPKKRYPHRNFLFWQYSGTGLSRGHPTKIDLNVFNGSESAWHKWVAKSAY